MPALLRTYSHIISEFMTDFRSTRDISIRFAICPTRGQTHGDTGLCCNRQAIVKQNEQ